jgi:hypothetical protein
MMCETYGFVERKVFWSAFFSQKKSALGERGVTKNIKSAAFGGSPATRPFFWAKKNTTPCTPAASKSSSP